MQSIRRAALRSALSASRAISTQAPAASFSASIARTALVSSRIQAIRFFSQSPRVLNTEEPTQPEQTETETAPAATEEAAVQKDTTEGHAAFVRNIVFDATEEHLKGAFEKFGNVTDVFLARDPRGLSKGYGFVTFATREALEEACSQVDGSFWHGRRISVEPRRAKVNRGSAVGEPSACLFIGNIPYETTDAELNNIFVGIDGLKDVRVAVDRATGWPRGFAHADFVDVEAAVNALEKLQGTQLGERTIKIDYAQPAAARQPRENNGERREYRPRQQRDGQRDGQRSYNRDGGNRSYNREGGNRNYNRDGGNRSYNREGGDRSYNREGGDRNYNRRDQGESTEF
ncbi:RNA-binding domain-containing protein [Neurospora crassa]|uniref:Nucleic acid-binding protein n=2 Tax=Neurospora crassa TaxID=5141 RepID=V5IRR9_NEUCR|nr:nucleic acid-binding protein [Neurospora crassa OR74A]ESA44356.1 nucleic acid-binding protein [Neurospora crassa OR74A]KHE89265.1 RNA-binding domain-containing protein [Neurospora crassa]CAE76253.1 related to heterogeneous nuclear ribonucleoprotein HRP1 [Neurospora crassa]|eukprot:XP_011393430.1 nucleic acid-binding protein [Neurospora crassa OR74A]